MSTQCTVGLLNADGTVLSVDVYSDGYPSYMLQRALRTYDTLDKARALVDGGDVSFLDLYDGVRSRRDPPSPGIPRLSKTHRNRVEYIRAGDSTYIYLFIDGKWEVVGP